MEVKIVIKTLFVMLVACVFCKGNNVVVKNHILYRQLREVSTSKAHWNVALIIDLKLFPTFLSDLQSQVSRIYGFIEIAKNQLDSDKIANIKPLVSTLEEVKEGLGNFENTQKVLLQEYLELAQILSPRTKRSLLPLGGVFKFLFGVADDRDLNGIKQSVSRIASSQKQVLHVLEHSLSIVNTSRMEISQNRNTINEILGTLQALKSNVDRQANRFERQFIQLTSFHELINSVRSMVNEVQQLYTKAHLYLVDFKIKLNMLSLQHLAPSLVSASHLRDLLRNIEDHIPQGFMLPLSLDNELWKYYSSLKSSTIINNDYLAVIIRVPLKPVSSSFMLMYAMPFPIPYDNSSATVKLHKNTKHLTAEIKLESSYFLIDDKHSQYVLLTSVQARECLENIMPFCEIEDGLSSTYDSNICLIGSYLEDDKIVEHDCVTMVSIKSKLPIARAMTKSQWLIVTNTKLLFTIRCLNGTSFVQSVSPPTFVVTLPQNCQAYSNRINLPLYFERNQTQQISMKFMLPPLKFNNISMTKIWKPIQTELANFSQIHIPKMLKHIETMPIDSLIEQIKQIDNAVGNNIKPWYAINWATQIISISGVLISIGIVLLFIKKGRGFCKGFCVKDGKAISSLKRLNDRNVRFTAVQQPPEESRLANTSYEMENMNNFPPSAPLCSSAVPAAYPRLNTHILEAYRTPSKDQGTAYRPL